MNPINYTIQANELAKLAGTLFNLSSEMNQSNPLEVGADVNQAKEEVQQALRRTISHLHAVLNQMV